MHRRLVARHFACVAKLLPPVSYGIWQRGTRRYLQKRETPIASVYRCRGNPEGTVVTKRKRQRMEPQPGDNPFGSQGRSWKAWTERQRAIHEANPNIAEAAFWASRKAELGRIIEGRHRQIERRAGEVAERLSKPPVLPDWLDSLLSECHEEFTARETEALVYRYGYELSLQEGADALGLNRRETFRRRLERAEDKIAHLRGDLDPDKLAAEEAEYQRRVQELIDEWDV